MRAMGLAKSMLNLRSQRTGEAQRRPASLRLNGNLNRVAFSLWSTEALEFGASLLSNVTQKVVASQGVPEALTYGASQS